MIKKFLNYVEIRTKITSLFTFMMTISYIYYMQQAINVKHTLIFFISMFIFDLTTTAINNYIDTKTNGQTLPFQRSTSLKIIYVLLILSTTLGLYLAYLTDIVVLLIGGLCFLCGIFYTFGPIPISRQPLGELLSGLFYGLLIPFLLLYMNMPPKTYVSLQLNWQAVRIDLQIVPLISLMLLAIAPICTTANIMLANNICDLEKDITVKRYTLPYYLGSKALTLFAGLYYLTYMATIAMVILKKLSPISLISLLSIVLVQKNISRFFEKQIKEQTFIYAIKNFVIIMGTNTLMILIGGIVKNLSL